MGDSLLEFDGEDLGEWGDGEGGEDGDEDEDELVEDDDGFPSIGPILASLLVLDIRETTVGSDAVLTYQRIVCVLGRLWNEDKLLRGHRLAICARKDDLGPRNQIGFIYDGHCGGICDRKGKKKKRREAWSLQVSIRSTHAWTIISGRQHLNLS